MDKTENNYKKSGVNIELANKFVKHIAKLSKKKEKKRKDKYQKSNIGSFGSCYDISKFKIKDPLLVSATDGVGTKIVLSKKFNKLNKIGIDLVAMCVNDLIVQGARPLFFLDYIAVGKLELNKTKKILKGIVEGCNISNCDLIGGETAEMPGVYENDKFDLAGFTVGIVSKKKLLGKQKVRNGDIILAIPSSGPHSNGYSLIRKIIKKRKINKKMITDILKPTKIYVREVLKAHQKNLINACAHITGGGLIENLIRSIPNNFYTEIDLSLIKIPHIFKWIKKNNVSDNEMLKTFNCGVGFCLIVKKQNIKKIAKYFSKNYLPYTIGVVKKGKGKYRLKNSLKW
tara:strand:+ start:1886 stop:2914 length:1029 start_codon:yes stop_codon:yes gene_type:complete